MVCAQDCYAYYKASIGIAIMRVTLFIRPVIAFVVCKRVSRRMREKVEVPAQVGMWIPVCIAIAYVCFLSLTPSFSVFLSFVMGNPGARKARRLTSRYLQTSVVKPACMVVVFHDGSLIVWRTCFLDGWRLAEGVPVDFSR